MEEPDSSCGEESDTNDETEKGALLPDSTENQNNLSAARQRAVLAAVTFLQFCALLQRLLCIHSIHM